jgi:light-regulated signal transduction histidine kinase (bacteriophytochrome)
MEKEMLEQIQQMITTATESLRQEMTGLAGGLSREMAGMKTELREEIAETKRHAGILAEDLHHKLDLVIEGQQFLGQRIDNVQADMDSKNRETRAFLELSYRQANERLERLEHRRDA